VGPGHRGESFVLVKSCQSSRRAATGMWYAGDGWSWRVGIGRIKYGMGSCEWSAASRTVVREFEDIAVESPTGETRRISGWAPEAKVVSRGPAIASGAGRSDRTAGSSAVPAWQKDSH